MGASCSVIHVVPCRYRFFPVAEPLQDTTDIAACSSYNLVKSCLTHPRRRDSCNLRDDLRDVLFSSRSHSRMLLIVFTPHSYIYPNFGLCTGRGRTLLHYLLVLLFPWLLKLNVFVKFYFQFIPANFWEGG